MEAKLKLDRPDDLTATMTMNMTVGEWKRLAHSLKTDYAGLQFAAVIHGIVSAAEKHFDQVIDVKAG
jgi:hypothetical protein